MTNTELQKKLLNDRRVINEIHRHQWLESEKSGHSISFETAAMDWLNRFSTAWMQYHMPPKASPRAKAKARAKTTASPKRRHAKSHRKKS